jgi:hypothetical protein
MDFFHPEKNSRENTFCEKLIKNPKKGHLKLPKRENGEENKRKFSEMEGFVEPVTQKCTNIMYLVPIYYLTIKWLLKYDKIDFFCSWVRSISYFIFKL